MQSLRFRSTKTPPSPSIISQKGEKVKSHRGDTLIEVALAIAVFSLVTIITIVSMNRSLEVMEGTLELSMARNEIDAQAEALRFIQNSFLSERELAGDTDTTSSEYRQYEPLWRRLTSFSGLMNNPIKISAFTADKCSTYYDVENTILSSDPDNKNHHIFSGAGTSIGDKAFIVNTRALDPETPEQTLIEASQDLFEETSLYPRVVFTNGSATSDSTDDAMLEADIYDKIAKVEGLWVIAARDISGIDDPASKPLSALEEYTPEFFDFYIRACWYSPAERRPSTISTIIRLYNPEYIQK